MYGARMYIYYKTAVGFVVLLETFTFYAVFCTCNYYIRTHWHTEIFIFTVFFSFSSWGFVLQFSLSLTLISINLHLALRP